MSKSSGNSKKNPKKVKAEIKPSSNKQKNSNTPSKKQRKPNVDLALALVPAEDLQALDEVELAAFEEYQRAIAKNRARKEQEVEPSVAIEADSWQFDMGSTTFGLLREETTVAKLTLDEQSMRTLVEGLNSAYILPDEEPPSYQVRIPDLYDAPPVLSLIKGGAVVGSLALDKNFNENVGSLLLARYPQKPQEPAWERFRAWVKAHKVRTVLLALLAIPVLILLVQGAYNSILASFN